MIGDMPAEEFRAHARALVDRVVELLENPATRRVVPAIEPGEVERELRDRPLGATGMPELLEEFERVVLPALTQWNHPGFLGYFPNTGSYPAILAELLATALNVNAMSWESSPGGTELERAATDHLRRMLGLPEPLFAEITDTASSGTLYALAAAREFAEDLEVRELGLAGRGIPRLRVYCSEEAHSSVDKAVATLGLGYTGVHRVATDDQFRMRADALRAAIAADRKAGMRPLAVVATVGTTSTTAIDPVREIAEVCGKERLWLHVDTAYGGAAAVIPEMRWVLDGCELADSLVVNPHKWLFVPMDCSVLYSRRPEMLASIFAFTPAILRGGPHESMDLMDYGVSLGRRLRSLKLWFVLRYFGAEGIADRLREHIRLARLFASWVERSREFELLAPVNFSTVVFRAVGVDADQLNARILQHVHAAGTVFISHTDVRGRYALRVAVGNIRTTEDHVRQAWSLVQAAAQSQM
ncbi:MAG TPA: pyridoxal-dependent decarboxylase [Gemmatimonadaceae bacterium]